MYNYFNCNPVVSNCILWGNTASSGPQIYDDGTSLTTATYSCIEGGWGDPSDFNIDADPRFVRDPDDGGDGWVDDPGTPEDESANNDYGDLHLRSDSPCIDAGDPNTPVDPNDTDIDGGNRLVDGDADGTAVIDMGADEAAFVYVSTDGNDAWTGLCETFTAGDCGPKATIQAGIDAANNPGTVVLIADGTYTGDGNRDLDFGGKAITVRSASGDPTTCIINCAGQGRGFYFHLGEGSDSVVEGLTITNGYSVTYGGAVYCASGCNPTFTNCAMSLNRAEYAGGGLYCAGFAGGTISDCSFNSNAATHLAGGGVHINATAPSLVRGCSFSGNTTEHNGGGASVEGLIDLVECVFHENATSTNGGALSVWDDTHVSVSRCAFRGNSAAWNGGGIYTFYPNVNLVLEDSLFSGNSAGGSGGGLHVYAYGVAAINRCTFTGNAAGSYGSGIYGWVEASVVLSDSIVWGNSSDDWFGADTMRFSCSSSTAPGSGNITADPLFVRNPDDGGDGWADDPGTPEDESANNDYGDLHLRSDSPCIDAGDPSFAAQPGETDLDGNPRVLDGDGDGQARVDMGADEVDGSDCNNNGVPDTQDIADGTSSDCNANGIPDECDSPFASAVVGFNDAPLDDPSDPDSQEMFRIPEYSAQTRRHIVLNSPPGSYDANGAYRGTGFQTEGEGALNVYFEWVDPARDEGWVQLTTQDAFTHANPALHLSGTVGFRLTNVGSLVDGTIGLCLGIRETGVDVPQLANGCVSGSIEWVGVDTTVNGITVGVDGIVDTAAAGDDVQVHPVGFDLAASGLPLGTAVVSPGINGVVDTAPAGDDVTRYGYFIDSDGQRVPIPAVTLPVSTASHDLQWDLATGTVCLDGVPQGGGIAGFTGDGVMAAPNARGTLEHLAVTNVMMDGGSSIFFAVDELQFAAPIPDPPPAEDLNGNGIPDECESDCNGNGVPDDLDIAGGTSNDCNGNMVPDECDIAAGTSADCNGNSVPDDCDITAGTSEDCNTNGIPDECEVAPTEVTKLLAFGGLEDDRFGYNGVAIDGTVAVVGAYARDQPDDDAGAAHVFRYTDGSWQQEAELFASDAASGDYFGYSVDVSGDRIVVGAYYADNPESKSGAAYVYRYDPGPPAAWTQEVKLLPDVAAGNDWFGNSVAIQGDVVVVGTPGDDEMGSSAGAAYVFRRSGSTWTQEAKLVAADGESGDWLGEDVAIDGDVVLVGAWRSGDYGQWSGSAYVFRYDPGPPVAWTQEAKLLASDGAGNDFFGRRVSVSGDIAVIGSHYNDEAAVNAGAAYVFRHDGVNWDEEQKLLAADIGTNEWFGCDVAIAGETILVGAHHDNDLGRFAGSAYVFEYTGQAWTQVTKILASDGEAEDYFGCCADLSGNRAILGAWGDDDLADAAGAAYIYDVSTADCNGNGIPDACESFDDCNGNGVPDECELYGHDCNGNGIPDACDIATDPGLDNNGNGVPDACEGPVRFVDDDALLGGTGVSWESPYRDLQDALAAAEAEPNNLTIHVAGGVYRPSVPTDPTDPRTATFAMLDGVTLQGGYAGLADPNAPDTRDPSSYIAVLSGDLAANNDPSVPFDPDAFAWQDNAYHVVTASGAGADAVLDGFTITMGNANHADDSLRRRGGGVYKTSGAPLISHCIFTLNNAAVLGGGMYSDAGDEQVHHCQFVDNSAERGGGFYNAADNAFSVGLHVHGQCGDERWWRVRHQWDSDAGKLRVRIEYGHELRWRRLPAG
jgi:hypothetical protein